MRRLVGRSPPNIHINAVRSWPRGQGDDVYRLNLTAGDRAELGRLAQVIEFKTAGSLIFAQGEDAGFLYLLADGLVRTCHTLHNGERQVLAFHWPGDLFGLAEKAKYTTAAETIISSKVYRFPIQTLEQFISSRPTILDGLLVKAVHDLRASQRQIIVMGRYDIPERVAAFLLDCSAHEAYFDAAQNVLDLPMSRYDIADYLGTSAETVTRAMARLERDGMLRRLAPRKLELRLDRLRQRIGLVD